MGKAMILITILLLLAGAWLIFFGESGVAEFNLGGVSPRLVGAPTAADSGYDVPALVDNYRNDEFRFSLRMPEGFTASTLPADDGGGKSVIMQDSVGNGIQIYVTPETGDARVLTADDVRAAIPDMQITDVQDVEIGDDYRGVAFLSDNEAFGGASREVWFYFRGTLYQISTYARLDPLLKAMFGTWKFF